MEVTTIEKMKKFNLIIEVLFAILLTACNFGLMEETKIALESSSKDVKNKILQIKKDAEDKGVNFAAFTSSETGSKVTNGGLALREAKIQAINEVEKFLKRIEEEALKLKEHGNSGQFLELFDLLLEVLESLEPIGIKGLKDFISEEAKCNPISTSERLIKVKVQIENKMEEVKKKQNLNKERKTNKGKKKK